MIRALLDLLGLKCAHRDLYRERREWEGVKGVMHWVCPKCDYARPVMDRGCVQHLEAIESGTPKVGRAKGSAKVIAMKERTR